MRNPFEEKRRKEYTNKLRKERDQLKKEIENTTRELKEERSYTAALQSTVDFLEIKIGEMYQALLIAQQLMPSIESYKDLNALITKLKDDEYTRNKKTP